MANAVQRVGQEGSRWVNLRPTGDEVAKWFRENVPLHEGMQPDEFITGVTLIPARAKEDEVTGFADNGAPILAERQNLHFVPYIKVETRVLYFWRYMEKRPEWLGVIEPAIPGEPGLPPGFFERVVKTADGKDVRFLCCSMRVRIYERDSLEQKIVYYDDGSRVEERNGNAIVSPPAGTKAVNVLGRYGPDENALMKAETGAIGRALGMAGILVLPGSGVATAEDMQDAAASEGRLTTGPAGAEAPQIAVSEGDLRKRAVEAITALQDDHPARLEDFRNWCRQRHYDNLSHVARPALDGLVAKVEAMLAEAVAARDPEAQPDVPVDMPLAPADEQPTGEIAAQGGGEGGEAQSE